MTEEKSNEMVKVALRCRPLSEKELMDGCVSIVRVLQSSNAVDIYNPKNETVNTHKIFTFDAVYDSSCTNQDIFEKSVQSLVRAVMNGFNCTIFAYGQSGAGKTHTMEGDNNDKGIIVRTIEQIFDIIFKSCKTQHLVRVSYLEIYCDEIRDLLCKSANKKCELRESKEFGVYVKNIDSFVCKSVEQMKTIIDSGKQNRSVGSTDINKKSSRSHAIITITVEMRCTEEHSSDPVRVGKFNLVDLAGSERQYKTNSEGKRLKEASRINLSLTALGNVISALADNKGHFIPYRDSKLTRLLRNSLGGNSKTLMIANIGPASCNYDESVNTLRYASRARNIRNKPRVNEDPVDALLRTYREEIERLRKLLIVKGKYKEKEKMNTQRLSETFGDDTKQNSSNQRQEGVKKDFVVGSTRTMNDDFASSKYHAQEYYMDELVKRIELMESKLLTGSTNILEHTFLQKETLNAHKDEIKELEQREKEIQGLIELHKESTEEIREEFVYLHNIIDTKSKQLSKVFKKLKDIKQEVIDVKEDFNKDRRELEITKYELWKDLKLKLFVNEMFIPSKSHRRILSKLFFDEELDIWRTSHESEIYDQILKKPKCNTYSRRPLSLYTEITQRKVNHIFRCNRTHKNREKTFRFKGENILELKLFQPLPSTKDFQHAKLTSQLCFKFKKALQEEENIDIDAKSFSLPMISAKGKFESALQSYFNRNNYEEQTTKVQKAKYPKARGLVLK